MKKLLIICLLSLSSCTTYNDLYMNDSTLTATVPQQTVVSNSGGWGGGWNGGYYNQGWNGWNTWRPWWGGWGWNNGGCY